MRVALASLALASLLASAPLAAAESVRVVKAGAEARREPGFSGAVVMTPAEGDVLEVLERRNEWARVKGTGGDEGWMHEVYLASAPDAPRPSAPPETAPVPSPPPPASGESADERLASLRSAMREAQVQNDYLTAKLASIDKATEQLREALSEAIEARDRARDDAERRVADAERRVADAREEGRRAAMTEAREKALAEVTSDIAQKQRLAAARAEGRAAAEEEARAALQAADSRRIDELADAQARHEAVMEQFIDTVTKRHDDALARESAAIDDECEQKVYEERREAERQLRIARKESGWEEQFEKDVRKRLDMEIEEARTRWEAKQRGAMYDVERAKKEEGERVRKEAEGQRLAAVNAAIASGIAEKAEALATERAEADLRCQLALELVLDRAQAGGDMTKVRGLATKAARRRSGEEEVVDEPVEEEAPPEEAPSPRPVPYRPPPPETRP